jgi:hypothetical protein
MSTRISNEPSNFYRYVAGGRTSSISACRSLLGVSGGFYAKDKAASSCATCDADHAALPSALIAAKPP